MRKIFTLAVVATVALFAARSSHADITLNAGSSTFTFDSDASGGDSVLQRSGFTNALEFLDIAIRTDVGGVVNVNTLGSGLTVAAESNIGTSSGTVTFTPYQVQGTTTPAAGSNLLIPTLNFSLTEDAFGNAILDLSLQFIGVNFNSGELGASTVSIDGFVMFDYNPVTPNTESASIIGAGPFAGQTSISDAGNGGALSVAQGDSSGVTVNTASALLGVINANNDFDGSIGGGSADLVAGLQFSTTQNVGLSTNFNENFSASSSAIPEPNSAFGFGFLLTFVLGWLGYDARKRQVARR